ncbi:condensation domain-containing protein [Labrys neptuniae]
MADESSRALARQEAVEVERAYPNGPALTPAEEELWLRQQQDPDAVLKHIAAFRLSGAVDPSRLVAALQAAFTALPGLNVRYRFSPDGELEKSMAADATACLRLERLDGEAAAVNLLLAEQAAPWDLEHQPPIRALVLLGADSLILGLVVHRILGGTIDWKRLLRAVSAAYHGRPLAGDERFGRSAPDPTSPAPNSETVPPLAPWLLRSTAANAGIVTDFAASPRLDDAFLPRVATRHGTVIAAASLRPFAGAQPTTADLLAVVALQFARFLAALGGKPAIDLKLSRLPAADFTDLALPFCEPHVVAVTLPSRLADGKAAAERIAAALQDPASGPLDLRPAGEQDRAPRPLAFVAFLEEAEHLLPLDGVTVERLPLPSLAPRPDLALGLGHRAGADRLSLELMTGQALSSAAGAFLLERFADFLAGGDRTLPLPQMSPREADVLASPAVTRADAIADLILAEFRRALSAPAMSADDDFFDHGGHSLIATRVIGRLLSTHGIEVHFNDLFRHPTAAGLAAHARRLDAEPEMPAAETAEAASLVAPLSLAQASLWKIYAAFGFSEIFNLPFALRFLDHVDETVFQRAFQDVLERHAGLRTLFRVEDGVVSQYIVPPQDLANYKWFWSSRESETDERLSEAGYRFDLARELPLRLRFFIEADSGRQVLSLLFHHMVLDEWSVNLMMDELSQAYRLRAAGKAPTWPEAAAPFHEFARLQHGAGLDRSHLDFWTRMLRDAPRNQRILPPSSPAEGEAKPPSSAGGWVELKFESAVTEGLYALAKESGASLFNVVYAAIASSLHLLGSLDELVVGTSASGRNNPDYFDTVGYFTTVVAHRIGFEAEATVGGLIETVKNTINGSLPYTDIPIDLVEEVLGVVREEEHLFEVFIQLHAKNKFNGAFTLEDGSTIAFRQVDPERAESVLGLQFEVMEEKDGEERSIRVMMTYRSGHYDQQQVALIRGTTMEVFRRFAAPGAAGTTLGALKSVVAASHA